MWQTKSRQFIDVNGMRLEAQCHGPAPGEKDTIVLLHEGLGSIDLWRNFPEKLVEQTGMGVFAYARQGYGRSDLRTFKRPVDFMRFEALEVLPGVLDVIGFEKGLFVGHSDGASIAAIYVGNVHDDRLRGAALMAPHFFIEEKTLVSIREAQRIFETTGLKQKMAKYHRDPDHTFYGWSNAWLDPEFANWNIEDALPGIKIPILAIQGKDDQYGTAAQLTVIGDNIGNLAELHFLNDCQHIPYLEQPEKTLALISAFAARL